MRVSSTGDARREGCASFEIPELLLISKVEMKDARGRGTSLFLRYASPLQGRDQSEIFHEASKDTGILKAKHVRQRHRQVEVLGTAEAQTLVRGARVDSSFRWECDVRLFLLDEGSTLWRAPGASLALLERYPDDSHAKNLRAGLDGAC